MLRDDLLGAWRQAGTLTAQCLVGVPRRARPARRSLRAEVAHRQLGNAGQPRLPGSGSGRPTRASRMAVRRSTTSSTSISHVQRLRGSARWGGIPRSAKCRYQPAHTHAISSDRYRALTTRPRCQRLSSAGTGWAVSLAPTGVCRSHRPPTVVSSTSSGTSSGSARRLEPGDHACHAAPVRARSARSAVFR